MSQKNLNKKLDILFKGLKIKKGDNIIIHSNTAGILQFYKKNKDDICKIFISYLKRYIGKNGIIIIPTYNYQFTKNYDFNIKTSSSEVGYLSNYLIKHNWNKRTLDPVFSHIIFGKINNSYFKNINTEAFGKSSIFASFQKKNFKIFCFCCSPNNITYLHFIENILKVSYRFVKQFTGNLIYKNNKRKIIYKYNVGKKNLDYSIKEKKIVKILNDKEFKRKKFGKFECYLFESNALIKKLSKILEKNEYYLIK